MAFNEVSSDISMHCRKYMIFTCSFAGCIGPSYNTAPLF